MKIFISQEMGSAYRVKDHGLQFAPLMKDGTFNTEDFDYTEPDMVGEEYVTFEGVDTNLYGVFATIKRRLTEVKK